METFPQGFFAARVNGIIKGVSTSQIIFYPSKPTTWDGLTDNGFIRGSHNAEGDTLYVVSLGVDPNVQGMGLGGRLLEAQKNLARELGLNSLVLGARIPGYNQYCLDNGEITPQEYLGRRTDKNESIDSEIRFYEKRGLRVKGIVAGFEQDPASRDYGVIMSWAA
ncbi:MAG: GNAT family N-acetyltransferase [Patescibacteria group bacterium]|nr:GNAT family N-acetyltransferase [Patescibacteria group bacterium]